MVAWRILAVGIAVAYTCAGLLALVPGVPLGPGYFAGSFAAGYLAGTYGRGARYGAAVAISGALLGFAAFVGFQFVALLGGFGAQNAAAAAHAVRGVLTMLTLSTLAAVVVGFVVVGGATLAGLSAVVGAAAGVVAGRLNGVIRRAARR